MENGIWAFSVAAIDTVGNVGEHSTIYISMNKYVPHTVISYINTKVDDFGTIDLSIFGNDFLQDGTINAIYISKDGKNYDAILTKDDMETLTSHALIQNGRPMLIKYLSEKGAVKEAMIVEKEFETDEGKLWFLRNHGWKMEDVYAQLYSRIYKRSGSY